MIGREMDVKFDVPCYVQSPVMVSLALRYTPLLRHLAPHHIGRSAKWPAMVPLDTWASTTSLAEVGHPARFPPLLPFHPFSAYLPQIMRVSHHRLQEAE